MMLVTVSNGSGLGADGQPQKAKGKNLLVTNPRADRDTAPAEAIDQAVHGVALAAGAVLHGDGAGAASVEGASQAAHGVVAGA